MIPLNEKNFSIAATRSGQILTLRSSPELFFVFFRDTSKCQDCRSYGPMIKKLELDHREYKFGTVDINNNMQLSRMASQTNTPLGNCHQFMIFCRHVVRGKYTNVATYGSLTNFLRDASRKLSQEQRPSSAGYAPRQAGSHAGTGVYSQPQRPMGSSSSYSRGPGSVQAGAFQQPSPSQQPPATGVSGGRMYDHSSKPSEGQGDLLNNPYNRPWDDMYNPEFSAV